MTVFQFADISFVRIGNHFLLSVEMVATSKKSLRLVFVVFSSTEAVAAYLRYYKIQGGW